MQKIRLVIRGWQRRREDKEKDFVARNVSWGAKPAAPSTPAAASTRSFDIDTEGLTVAYLDDSGVRAYFLDTDGGDIVDLRVAEIPTHPELRPPRYRRVPARSEKSDAEDRNAFVASLENTPVRSLLTRSTDADSFRRALASDRTVERAWYNFKNDRAIAVIEAWLETF